MFVSTNKLGDNLVPAESLYCALDPGDLISQKFLLLGQMSIGTFLWPPHAQQGTEACRSFLVKMNSPLLSF